MNDECSNDRRVGFVMSGFSTSDVMAWDREFLWHPFTPMKAWCEEKEIVVIERGEGEFLIDMEGRRYIDGTSSVWCNVHGHCVPELDAAVREQLGKIAHTTLLGLANVPSAVLGKRLVELARGRGLGLDKVFYSDDGSTAVEVACKMAFSMWRMKKSEVGSWKKEGGGRFLALSGAYHGDTVGAVSVGGIGAFHEAFRGLCFAADFVEPPRREEEVAEALEKVRGFLERGDCAGIVIEPIVQGAGGMVVQAKGFLRGVRRLADEFGVLLIADEVMTGFGRTGKMFACEHEGVTPDLMCLSKGLTAGYMPLGVTLTTKRVFDAFYADPREGKTFFHGHTFTGHPLACAVAVASLDLFEQRGLMGHVERMGAIMAEVLEGVRGRPFVRDVRYVGMIGAIELGDEKGAAFPYQWRVGGEICRRMRALGLMMRPLGDVVVVMPPLAIGEESFRRLLAGVVESVGWVKDVVDQKAREVAV